MLEECVIFQLLGARKTHKKRPAVQPPPEAGPMHATLPQARSIPANNDRHSAVDVVVTEPMSPPAPDRGQPPDGINDSRASVVRDDRVTTGGGAERFTVTSSITRAAHDDAVFAL